MDQGENSREKLAKAKKDKSLLRAKWLNKKEEYQNTFDERTQKQAELNELASPKEIKRVGITALILYLASFILFIGALFAPAIIVPFLIAFIAYIIIDAVFCNFNARNPQFAFLNVPTLGLFGLVDIIIRINRAPFMKEKLEKQIEELLDKEEKLEAEIADLENEIGELKESIKNIKT